MRRKRFLVDETSGAFFVSWATGSPDIHCWPASWGIVKRKGCVFFEPYTWRCYTRLTYRRLWPWQCKRKFRDVPAREEAWLVKLVKGYWIWEHVDPLLMLIK